MMDCERFNFRDTHKRPEVKQRTIFLHFTEESQVFVYARSSLLKYSTLNKKSKIWKLQLLDGNFIVAIYYTRSGPSTNCQTQN